MQITKNLIIKILFSLFLIVYLGLLYFSDRAGDVSVDRISSAMSATSVTEMEERGRSDLSRFFSISESEIDGCVYYKALSPMAVDECLIVKARDRAGAKSLLERAEAHLESQKNVFGAYGTFQMALLNDAFVESKGNYVYYMCGDDAPAWRDAFLALI